MSSSKFKVGDRVYFKSLFNNRKVYGTVVAFPHGHHEDGPFKVWANWEFEENTTAIGWNEESHVFMEEEMLKVGDFVKSKCGSNVFYEVVALHEERIWLKSRNKTREPGFLALASYYEKVELEMKVGSFVEAKVNPFDIKFKVIAMDGDKIWLRATGDMSEDIFDKSDFNVIG